MDVLRQRMIKYAIRPAEISTNATPPTAPPAIAPTFNPLLVAAGAVGVEITCSAVAALVARGTGDNSGPPAVMPRSMNADQ